MKLEFRNANSKGLYFHAVFTYDAQFCSPWNWPGIEMQPWESKANICHESHSRVQFAIEQPVSDFGDISDLCAAIIGPISSWEWLGAIKNHKGTQHRIRAIDHQQRLPSFKSIETVSLAEVISDKAFRLEQRSRLALKLASSVMQLHTTKWLSDYWSKSDISFLRSLDKVDFDNPLIRRSFGPRLELASLSDSLPNLYLNIPCLFSLGVVLLELWYREALEKLKNETARKMVDIFPCIPWLPLTIFQPPEYYDDLTARRLASEMDCSPNYKNSVLRCVRA
ncbi:Synaptobrevin [Penicillium lividum]|nr:Synaptobrevin [Penicillium lividum]